MHKKTFIYLLFISSILISCNNGNNHSVFSADESESLNNDGECNPLDGDYLIGNKKTIYNAVLGEFDNLLKKARTIKDENEKTIALAKAESKLIDSAVFMPYSYGNINYQLTRIVPNTYYAINDIYPYSYKNILLVDSLIDNCINNEINDLFINYYNNDEFYDELLILLSKKGYSLCNELKVFYDNEFVSLNPFDNLTYANEMLLRQVFDSLFEYDIFGNIKCNIANTYSYNYSTNELIISIKNNAFWYKNNIVYDKIDAYDFLYSYKLLLDNNKYCKYIKNSIEYCEGKVDFVDVGIEVIDSNTIKYETDNVEGLLHFLTTLISSPVHEDFINSKCQNRIFSGCYYIDNYDVYNVSLRKICSHYNSSNSFINHISFFVEYLISDEIVNKVVSDKYSSMNFINNKELYSKLTLNDKTSPYLINAKPNNNVYYSLFNLNRTDYLQDTSIIQSTKNENEHLSTWLAIQNLDFRKAIYHCIDKKSIVNKVYNNSLVKNTITSSDFKYIDNNAIYDGVNYQKNMSYGDIVQSFLDFNIHDNSNDSYSEEKAKYHFNKFENENSINGVIRLDLLYLSKNKEMTYIANCFKNNVESILNKKVIIDLIDAETMIQYLHLIDDKAYDIIFGFGYRPEDNSIYNNLYDFTLNGINSTLIL